MPLTVLESPYREITRPVVDYVKDIRRDSPREIVVVFVPQYVVGHWWENVLHNQSALRLRARLQFQPGVMITTVPWQLESSIGRDDGRRRRGPAPGDLRRGLTDDGRQHPLWLTAGRAARPPVDRGLGWVGAEFEVTVGPVAHGGHCVARHEGRVVFVRHALPGERVVVRVTEDRHPGFCRADAVEVLEALAGPRRAALPVQRPRAGAAAATGSTWPRRRSGELKAAVVREQLARLAGLDDVDRDASRSCPGGPLRWRSRARFAVDRSGRAGAAPAPLARRRRPRRLPDHRRDRRAGGARPALARGRRGRRSVDSTGAVTTTRLDRRGHPTSSRVRAAGRRPARGAGRRGPSGGPGVATGRSRAPASGRCTRPPPTRWSARSPASPSVRPGETVLDLYAGAGLFGGALAPAVGAGGPGGLRGVRRGGLRGGRRQPRRPAAGRGVAGRRRRRGAGRAARRARQRAGRRRARPAARRRRAGRQPAARRDRRPAVVYVACDPAALARDVAAFGEAGYRLAASAGFDAFPMTAHVECVALLVPA